MEKVDRVRRVGGVLWVVVGLVFEIASYRQTGVLPGPVTLLVCGVVILLTMVTLIGNRRAIWLLGWVAAVLLGLNFAGAVADRFGALGPPGTAGVSWGGWQPFVDYTARLMPGAGSGLVTAAALGATAVEVMLGMLLVSGWQRRWVGKAAAGLLFVYLVFMGWALGLQSVAVYGLPLQIGGALLVSSCAARRPAASVRAERRRGSPVRSTATADAGIAVNVESGGDQPDIEP